MRDDFNIYINEGFSVYISEGLNGCKEDKVYDIENSITNSLLSQTDTPGCKYIWKYNWKFFICLFGISSFIAGGVFCVLKFAM